VTLTKRIFIAALGTETNQFVPFPTGRSAYEEHGMWRGDATRHEPTNFTAPLHVWRKAAEARGWTVIEGLATFAAPSGTTVRPVYERFRDEILAGIKAALPLDAVLINVHGAMVADGYDDCEGDLLARVRAIVGSNTAIGAEFDLHCHLSALMLDSADVLVGYKEYPHTDTMERAAELFAIIADTFLGKVKPVMARHDCRMIAQYRTSVPPINEFVTRMKSLEGKDGILSVSLSHGFAFADVEDVGTRTLVVADRDKGKAEALAKQLGEELWANRERYATKYLSIPEAMERAASHNQGPLVLADRADNPGSGFRAEGTCRQPDRPGAVRGDVGSDGVPHRRGGRRRRAAAHAAGRQIGRGERPAGRSRRHGEEDRARRAPALQAGDGAVGRHGAAVIGACRRGDLHAAHPDLPCRRLQGGRRRSGRLSSRRGEIGAAFL
jgi:microcystin degradation protein MlrC